MPEEITKVSVQFTLEFKRNLRALSKKYRHIRDDIEPVISELQNGNLPGKRVTGIGHTIYKVRVPNRDRSKGKSGGYRIIYYLKTAFDVILITIYSKTEQSDVSAARIRRIVGRTHD
ncbi:MAG: type II toxin-antitoxin system RelE/ParE family toxin [Desulfobacteraceae bacterium]|jgi:mRNA-degrading endonuclease RelE of RelBE toxin-antitoxin system|nr:MAG: type II toxin-antitoxin system RelE/ParE family toxin [Desulfobacteraceae bacterium]